MDSGNGSFAPVHEDVANQIKEAAGSREKVPSQGKTVTPECKKCARVGLCFLRLGSESCKIKFELA